MLLCDGLKEAPACDPARISSIDKGLMEGAVYTNILPFIINFVPQCKRDQNNFLLPFLKILSGDFLKIVLLYSCADY